MLRKDVFSLQSPADLGRVQRKRFCELWFVNESQELVIFLRTHLDVVRGHDYQGMVFTAICRYLDTSKCFMLGISVFKYHKATDDYDRSVFLWNLCLKLHIS